MQTAIVGGGAAGFFLAVNLKAMAPQMRIVIFESGQRVLRKVRVSGGGRCNCTNSFDGVTDLSEVYPRGHRLMRRLFHTFGPQDAYRWFEAYGVRLTTQADGCVFPASQDSRTIINCLTGEARRLGVEVVTGRRITDLDELTDYDCIALTTGGGMSLCPSLTEAPPCPSLFTFTIEDEALRALMGTVVEGVTVGLCGTKFKADGPLLVTHWGVSGPAVLRLSSYAARHLFEQGYHAMLSVNWLSQPEAEVRTLLMAAAKSHPQRQVASACPVGLPSRLWQHLVAKASVMKRWADVNAKDMNRLCNVLTNDTYPITGRSTWKEEFVTCGGISLSHIDPHTLECRQRPGLYFAGEVLDIDGVTGGFNFQTAWTTAYCVAQAIAQKSTHNPSTQ